jgi:hypothetical protein
MARNGRIVVPTMRHPLIQGESVEKFKIGFGRKNDSGTDTIHTKTTRTIIE